LKGIKLFPFGIKYVTGFNYEETAGYFCKGGSVLSGFKTFALPVVDKYHIGLPKPKSVEKWNGYKTPVNRGLMVDSYPRLQFF
jgi:hypothetical protein